MALASRLLLLKTTEIHPSYFLKIFHSHSEKTKITPLLCKYKRHFNLLWTFNVNIRLHYSILTLLPPTPVTK